MSAELVFLYVTDTLADWEAGHAVAHIRKASWQRRPGRYDVRTVGRTREPITTMGGVHVVPDAAVADVDPADAAMLILPGAETWEDIALHADVLELAHRLVDARIPVAAICGGTFGLASAGLLDDRAHTSNAAEYLAMSGYAGGALYRDEPAVTDRGIITASGTHPVDFAAHVFRALDLYEPRVLDAWHGLYTTGRPEHFAALTAAA